MLYSIGFIELKASSESKKEKQFCVEGSGALAAKLYQVYRGDLL